MRSREPLLLTGYFGSRLSGHAPEYAKHTKRTSRAPLDLKPHSNGGTGNGSAAIDGGGFQVAARRGEWPGPCIADKRGGLGRVAGERSGRGDAATA